MRALTSLGLKEAKDLVDGAPQTVLEKVTKEAADKAKDPRGSGALVEARRSVSGREARPHGLGGTDDRAAAADERVMTEGSHSPRDMKETFHLSTARAKVRRGFGSVPDRWPRRCAT